MGKEIWLLIAIIGGAFVMALLFLGIVILCRRYHTRRTSERPTYPKVVQETAPAGITSELLANASKLACLLVK